MSWDRIIAVAGPAVILMGMWIVHLQEQAIDNDKIIMITSDMKEIRQQLLEIERRLPRHPEHE